MKRAFACLLTVSLCLLLKACDTTDPPDNKSLLLKLEDVSCTEAWITLTTTNLPLPTTVTLKRDGTVTQDLVLSNADSLLYIDSLLPNQTYSFVASHSGLSGISSNELSVNTMDTTSHNFTFETFTFGGTAGSSTLYDVAIINENDIWAVGDIKIADTSQNGYSLYNAMHFDGNDWELKRVMFYTFCGQQHQNAYPASSIIAFSEDEIWISMKGDQIAKIENGFQTQTVCMPWIFTINKIWGNSSSDLYVVGNNGNMAHYSGTAWQRIESRTDLNINDIWGDYNEKTNEWEILAVASNKYVNEGKKLLKIDGVISTELSTIGLPWSLSSIWFKTKKKYFIAGDGLYYKKLLSENWIKDETFISIYKDRIRGTNFNNIVVSGSNGLLSHFNGFYWKHYINNELPYFSGRFLSSDLNDNLIIAVGWQETRAIITVGRR